MRKQYLVLILVLIISIYKLNQIYTIRRRAETYKLDSQKIRNEKSEFRKIISGEKSLKSFTTIISVYYQLEESKHSKEDYEEWALNFLNSISSPLILYTEEKFYSRFYEKLKNLNATIYVSKSHWDCLKLIERSRGRKYIEKYNSEQFMIDPEKCIHNPSLYAVWNTKFFISNQASIENPYRSEFFIFTDMGAWRERVYNDWPDQKFVQKLSNRIQDQILFSQINEFEKDSDMIQAGIFAGTAKALQILYNNYFDLHDLLLDEKKFVGKEQNIMNYLAFYIIKDKIVRLKTWDLDCDRKYDNWFFYQTYFALEKAYYCQNDKLSLIL